MGDGHGKDCSPYFQKEKQRAYACQKKEKEFLFLSLVQGKKTDSQSQNTSMCPSIHGTRFFPMSFHLILEGGGGGKGAGGGGGGRN